MALEIGTYFPERVLTNEDIASWNVRLGGKLLTAQSIFEKVGVKRRFIAGEDETALFMGVKAVKSLPNFLESPDMVYFSTSYPDGVNNAEVLIRHFGYTADGFENVHAACSGSTFSLSHIFKNKERFLGKRILLVASEKYSPALVDLRSDDTDLSLAQTIFSDGAVAMSFTEGQDLKILNALNYSFPKEESACLRMPVN